MQIVNVNTINDGDNTTFNKSSLYEESDFSYYLPLDSDILENIIDLIHMEEGGRIQAS